ncbi:mannose-6-phosphate isomerase, class I [Polymorphospora sp. NPDC050346]|uniref:mannose-6-phosphate isomerase, class I n=1 Tax=Polymorphospora sp. NPDC050346 TaxID=3155780 RepID=UPI00340D7D6F
MRLLRSPIRDYAWGSRSVIAELQGRPAPSDGPEAELWLGAHPGAPSLVELADGTPSLVDVIAAAPGHWLGSAVVSRFGPQLPYLMKVLAADAPLSLQAHPDLDQARAGYAAQAVAGAGHRNYADGNHKPELLVALTPFEALCGFQRPDLSADVLAGFGIAALDPVIASLRAGVDGLREAVRLLLCWPPAERSGLVAAVAAAELPERFAAEQALARRLAGHYPGDPGVLVALLLNHVRLEPGEAVWMPAGNLHAYLRGAGVEIMAASDNVLRGGLTPKHVDVAELLRVLRFEVLDEVALPPVPVSPGVVTWPVPVPDFVIHRVTVDGESPRVTLPVDGPRVVLCTAGQVAVTDGSGAVDPDGRPAPGPAEVVTVPPGRAAIGAAAGGALTFTGAGTAYVASVGVR